MDIFDRIELLLKRNHMSQADLSRATGISTGLISQWKKRSQSPSNQKLAILTKYFDVSVDYLLGKEDSPAVQPSKLSDDAYRVAAAYDKAEPAIQSSVRKLLDL